ncbi:MAG: 2-dehydropantoate 2-reductase [Verrucomicrobiota bacterium]
MKPQKIAVIGSGAVGCFYGAVIQQAHPELEVHFLMRSDLETVHRDGLIIQSDERDDFTLQPVRCAATTDEIGPVDLILIALKTTDNAALDSMIPALLHDQTAIVTLQNGLGNEDYLAQRFGAHRVLGALCFVCINRTAPGVIHHIAHGLIEMGEFSVIGETERTTAIQSLFEKSGVPCVVRENLMQAKWRKLVWNVPFNGLSIAAGELDVERILADPDLKIRVKSLMMEVIAAAAAFGIEIPEEFADQNISRTEIMGPYLPSSLIDFSAGKPVETESIWGEPLRRGLEKGVAMPELEKLYAEIKVMVASRSK